MFHLLKYRHQFNRRSTSNKFPRSVTINQVFKHHHTAKIPFYNVNIRTKHIIKFHRQFANHKWFSGIRWHRGTRNNPL